MPAATAAAEARCFRVAPDSIVAMDDWVEAVGRRWGIEERALFRARVCVSELASNILEHGGVGAGSDMLVLELRHVPPGIEFEISDSGVAFDPSAAPVPDANLERIGGRGMRLVRSYARCLSYRRNNGRNVLTVQLMPSAG